MKRIETIRHLEAYGLDALTGEADKHVYRLLFDVTALGKRILERTMDTELKLHPNWNSGKKSDPHIGSILLPLEFLPSISCFALLSDSSVNEVWLMKSGLVLGFGVEDVDQKQEYKKFYEGEIKKIFYSMPSDRNVHQFSGRTA